MELKLYWKIVWRWWWLILLPALVVGGYGLATYRAPAGAYTTTLRFTAAQPGTDAPPERLYDQNYYRWLTSEYIVSGLKDWVRTGLFAQAVSDELAARGTAIPAGAVAGAIASDNARSVLVVYLTWGDQTQLLAMAEAVMTVLQERNGDVFPQLGGQPAAVTPLDTPAVGSLPPSLRARLDLPLKVGLALAFGCALALLAFYLDPFVRDRDDAAAAGLAVLAEIPGRGRIRRRA